MQLFSGSKMTTGSFNNQSLDIAVSDTVVRLRYGFREGCSFTTCGVSEFVLVPSSGKKIRRSPGIKPGSHFMVDLELLCGHAQFGQNIKFNSFYGV